MFDTTCELLVSPNIYVFLRTVAGASFMKANIVMCHCIVTVIGSYPGYKEIIETVFRCLYFLFIISLFIMLSI